MKLSLTKSTLLLGLLAMLASSPRSVHATEIDMWKLPAYDGFGCMNCHNNARDTIDLDASLNAFGTDWLSEGREWSEKLAGMDSDGDRCLNGAELRDYSGRWRPPAIPEEHDGQQVSNPGAGDCVPASLDDRSFGILKAVFGDANKFKVR